MSANLSQLPLQELNSLRRHAREPGFIHDLDQAIGARLRLLSSQTAHWRQAVDQQVSDESEQVGGGTQQGGGH